MGHYIKNINIFHNVIQSVAVGVDESVAQPYHQRDVFLLSFHWALHPEVWPQICSAGCPGGYSSERRSIQVTYRCTLFWILADVAGYLLGS